MYKLSTTWFKYTSLSGRLNAKARSTASGFRVLQRHLLQMFLGRSQDTQFDYLYFEAFCTGLRRSSRRDPWKPVKGEKELEIFLNSTFSQNKLKPPRIKIQTHTRRQTHTAHRITHTTRNTPRSGASTPPSTVTPGSPSRFMIVAR